MEVVVIVGNESTLVIQFRGSSGAPRSVVADRWLSHSLEIARNLLDDIGSQANEGMWGMPGHTEAMKAVVSCDKLGEAAHTH